MKKLLFALVLLFQAISCLSQSLDSNVVIHQTKQNKLYTGRPNLIVIEYKVDSFQHILVTASQGEVSSIDKYLHRVNLRQKGKVLISVYDVSDGKIILLNHMDFTVDTVILSKAEMAAIERTKKCNLSIDGFSGIKIPLSIAKKATKFTVDAPYKIKSATIYIGTNDAMVYHVRSGIFDTGFLAIWKRIGAGTVVTLENVLVIDAENKTYNIYGKSFSVIND